MKHANDPHFSTNDNIDETMNINNISENILNNMTILACNSNISAKKMASSPMKEFVKNLIHIGINLGAHNYGPEILQMLRFYGITTITKKIKEYGLYISNTQQNRLKEIKFINILCDAGTVNKYKCIHVMGSNPFYDNMPVLFEITTNDNYTKEKYEILFQKEFEYAQSLDLIVCSIICDNLPAQQSGLKSFLNSDNRMIRSIEHIPCLSHMINLVFIHSLRQSLEINALINSLSDFVTLLRKEDAVRQIGKLCPKPIQTRWLYIYEPLLFIYQNRNTISELGYQIPIEFEELRYILTPLKCFLLEIERKESKLFWVIDLFEEMLKQWKEIVRMVNCSSCKKYLNVLISIFIAKLYSNNYESLCTASLLSKNGRQNIRRIQFGYNVIGRVYDVNVVTDHVSRMREHFQKWVLDINSKCWDEIYNKNNIQIFNNYIDKLLESEDDSSDEDSNYTQNQLDYFGSDEDESWSIDSESENNCEESDEEIPQEEIELDNINLQTYNEIYQMSIDDKLSQDVFNRIFHIGEKKLIETATILGIDSNLISTRLYEWIFTNAESNVQLANIFINDENTIWRRLHCYDEWSQFSEIALRFISIGCSESDVERSLSLQKEVLNMHTYNIGSDTLEARMRAQQEIHNQKNYI